MKELLTQFTFGFNQLSGEVEKLSKMAGGSFTPAGVAKDRSEMYQGRVTSYVIIACIVAAIGGSIFGYDVGISGNSLLFLDQVKTSFDFLFKMSVQQ